VDLQGNQEILIRLFPEEPVQPATFIDGEIELAPAGTYPGQGFQQALGPLALIRGKKGFSTLADR